MQQKLVEDGKEAIARADVAQLVRLLDNHFGKCQYSLKSLFLDEQQLVLERVLKSVTDDIEIVYHRLYKNHVTTMDFLAALGLQPPKALRVTAEFVLNTSLHRALAKEPLDIRRISSLLSDAKSKNITLDSKDLAHSFGKTLERMAERLAIRPTDLEVLKALKAASRLLKSLPFEVNLWRTQNTFHEILERVYPKIKKQAKQDGPESQDWLSHFVALGNNLAVRIPWPFSKDALP